MSNYKTTVPACFNFGFDVVDRTAGAKPDKIALVWCNDTGDSATFTFAPDEGAATAPPISSPPSASARATP